MAIALAKFNKTLYNIRAAIQNKVYVSFFQEA